MRIQDANNLTAGKPLYYRDMTSLLEYAASVGSITPNATLGVTITSGAVTNPVFDLSGDGERVIPVFALL